MCRFITIIQPYFSHKFVKFRGGIKGTEMNFSQQFIQIKHP